jgi:hypothetical protein
MFMIADLLASNGILMVTHWSLPSEVCTPEGPIGPLREPCLVPILLSGQPFPRHQLLKDVLREIIVLGRRVPSWGRAGSLSAPSLDSWSYADIAEGTIGQPQGDHWPTIKIPLGDHSQPLTDH